jgi:hypothetical protein
VQTLGELLNLLERLPERFEVCYEASCVYGFYHDLLKPLAWVGNRAIGQRALRLGGGDGF